MILKRNSVMSKRETALVLWLLAGGVVGTLSVTGLGAALVVAAGTLVTTILIVVSDVLFKRFIFVLLVSKPIIDLAWRIDLGAVTGQRLNLQTLVGVYAIVFVITAWIVRKRVIFSWPIVGLALAASLSLLVSALSANGFSDGLNDFLRLISGLSLFLVVGYVLCIERMFTCFAWWLVVAITIPLLLSVLQVKEIIPYEYWDWIEGAKTGRLTGSYPHPLNLASYLVYGHLLALYLLNRSIELGKRLFLLAWMGLLYYVLYYTYHRTTYLIIALQLITWLYLHKRWFLTFLVSAIGGAVALAERGILKELYATLLVAFPGSAGIFSRSFLRGRGEQWSRYLSDFTHSHPLYWLLGRGNALLVSNYPQYVLSNNEPHNDFLRLLYTYGVVGLLFYLGVLLMFLVIALRLVRITADRFEWDLAYLVLLSVFSIAILSITVEPMRYPTSVWYLFGLGSAVTMRYRLLIRTRCINREGKEN